MSQDNFPHHSGGVLQVRHSAKWGAVPEALLEDPVLDLDSRAVAAWLAIKPAGWQISVSALRRRLGRIVQRKAGDTNTEFRILGKDRWQRIARELEAGGYLMRQQQNGGTYQWIWNIVFNPTPSRTHDTRAGFPGDGFAGTGSASAGEASPKDIPSRRNTNRRKTTTDDRPAAPPEPGEQRSISLAKASDVVVSRSIEQHREVLVHALARSRLDRDAAQQIADELAGVLRAQSLGRHKGILSVRSWLERLIKLHGQGLFVPEFGPAIATERLRAEGQHLAEAVAIVAQPETVKAHVKEVIRLHKLWQGKRGSNANSNSSVDER